MPFPIASAILGAAGIGAVSSLIGGRQNAKAQASANRANIEAQRMANEANIAMSRETNAMTQRIANRNFAEQQKFAKSGITWRVQDAVNAGLHPLAAIGAAGASHSPVSAVFDSPHVQAAQVQATRPGDGAIAAGNAIAEGIMQLGQLERHNAELLNISSQTALNQKNKDFVQEQIDASVQNRSAQKVVGTAQGRGPTKYDMIKQRYPQAHYDSQHDAWYFKRPTGRYYFDPEIADIDSLSQWGGEIYGEAASIDNLAHNEAYDNQIKAEQRALSAKKAQLIRELNSLNGVKQPPPKGYRKYDEVSP